MIDGHSDVLIDVLARRLDGETGSLLNIHLPRWRQGGVSAALCPVTVDNPSRIPNDTDSAFNHLRQIREEVDAASEHVVIALSAQDIRYAFREGKFALLLGLEGATPLGEDPFTVKKLYDQEIRWVTLTWNDRNQVGNGVGVLGDGGLTKLGEQVVTAMNEQGILVDISHASLATFSNTIATSRAPVVATHSNARTLCDHVRNLNDKQIRAVADTGGTIGINFFPSLVATLAPTLADVVRHIDYLCRIVGVDAIAIGADFIDFAEDTMGNALKVSSIDYGDRLTYPDGLENTTKLPALVHALDQCGYTEADIRNIAGHNILRVLEQVERYATEASNRA